MRLAEYRPAHDVEPVHVATFYVLDDGWCSDLEPLPDWAELECVADWHILPAALTAADTPDGPRELAELARDHTDLVVSMLEPRVDAPCRAALAVDVYGTLFCGLERAARRLRARDN